MKHVEEEMEQRKKKLVFPILVGLGLVSVIIFLGITDTISPLIQYIHTNSINPWAGVLCVIAGVAGFYTVFRLLVKLGSHFLPDQKETK